MMVIYIIAVICVFLTIRARPSSTSPFVVYRNATRARTLALHLDSAHWSGRKEIITELVTLMTYARTHRLTMNSPLLVEVTEKSPFIKKLVSELACRGAVASATYEAPRPTSLIGTLMFWPTRHALAKTPNRLQICSHCDRIKSRKLSLTSYGLMPAFPHA
ncbi:hypothetical protein [Bordetella sp. N]|uniref:hypothetical protein n=1 Tax=Bordetella sp. N TaxID=1746199 RepID=UPI0012E3DE06|nr:hypothetical protein [Bordetella sp. N]